MILGCLKYSFELPISKKPKSARTMATIESIALASIRYEVEDRPTTAIATATLEAYSRITPKDNSQVIDPSKVRRAIVLL